MSASSTRHDAHANCGCPVPPVGRTILAHDLHGTGPEKVVVLHSWMGNARSFDAVKPWLDTGAFTYAFADLRGYGRSRTFRGSFTAGEAATDALHLADHLGWRRFHVVGHSMSGLIVQRLILDEWPRAERRVKSAVAITPVTADGFPAGDGGGRWRGGGQLTLGLDAADAGRAAASAIEMHAIRTFIIVVPSSLRVLASNCR